MKQINMEVQAKTTIGTTLRKRRQELKLSQQALVGDRYSKTYLSKVECGQLEPSAEFLTFLGERLHLNVNDLMAEANIKPKKASRKIQEMELMNAHVALQSRQPEKARHYLERLEPEQLPPDLEAVYYATYGEAEVEMRQYNEALTDLEKSLKLHQALPRVTALQVERVRNWIGLAYYRMRNFYSALTHHRTCLQAINDGLINDNRFKLKVYYNLANDYLATGEQEQAMNLYKEAVKLAEEGDDDFDLAGIYWGIGLAHYNAENYPMAKLYLAKSADLHQKIGQGKIAAEVKNILGQTMVARNEFEEAEKTLRAAIEESAQYKDSNGLSIGNMNLAYLYYKQARYPEAAQSGELSIKYGQDSGDKRILGQAQAQLAEIKLAQSATEEGLRLFDEAIGSLEQTDSIEMLAKIYFRYAAALENAGKLSEAIQKYRKAYDYQKTGKLSSDN